MEDKKYVVVVCGSRGFDDYDYAKRCLNWILEKRISDGYDIVVVSGRARGADLIGERWANEYGYEIDSHPANWDLYGKSAGYIRNCEMVDVCDGVVAFWDGISKGTKHTIDYAGQKGKPCVVVNYNKQERRI
jgi:hypothetical protein